MRRAGRTDGNQTPVVNDLRSRGFSVLILSGVGKGCPDLCVGKWGQNVLVELKDPAQPPSRTRLTPDEAAFHAGWRGKVIVAKTAEEIIAAFDPRL